MSRLKSKGEPGAFSIVRAPRNRKKKYNKPTPERMERLEAENNKAKNAILCLHQRIGVLIQETKDLRAENNALRTKLDLNTSKDHSHV